MIPKRLYLPLALLAAGLIFTAVHDLAFRRGDTAGEGDYELGGLITHAGVDMILTTGLLVFIAVLWPRER